MQALIERIYTLNLEVEKLSLKPVAIPEERKTNYDLDFCTEGSEIYMQIEELLEETEAQIEEIEEMFEEIKTNNTQEKAAILAEWQQERLKIEDLYDQIYEKTDELEGHIEDCSHCGSFTYDE